MVKICKILIFMLMLTYVACSKLNNEPEKQRDTAVETKDAKSEEVKDIPSNEYSLVGTSCQWINLNSDSDKKPILVNSDEELRKYIIGTDYPPVDFSKQTLLLASNRTNYGIAGIINSLQQLSVDKYKWTVEITLNDATVIEDWVKAILTDKLSKESEVELYVNVIIN